MTMYVGRPCPRCVDAMETFNGIIVEMIQPLPSSAPPLARDGTGPCCRDCAAADALVPWVHPQWVSCRIATGNDRMEQIRLPGAPMGLVAAGFMRANEEGDLERHHAWLNIHFPGWSEGVFS